MMENCFLALLFVCGGLLPLNLYATDGAPVWTNIFSRGTSGSDDRAVALAVDGNGNVYVVGQTTETPESGYDFTTLKYSKSGSALWTNYFGGVAGGDDQPRALAVDGRGGVYVAGRSYVGPSINWDFVTIKYSSAGVAMWTNYFDGPGHGSDDLKAIAVDSFGNVFVVGSSTGLGTGSDITTIKYSSAGVGLWTNTFDGGVSNNEQANALGVDGNGNVFVTGFSTRVGTGKDFVTIKYSNSGVALWTNYFDGVGYDDQPVALGVDWNGDVSVAGNLTGYVVNRGNVFDYVTVKYSNAGVSMWTNVFNGSGNGEDHVTSLAVDTGGNVYVAGYSVGDGTSWDYTIIKYSRNGVGLWTNVFNGTANFNDFARALALDKNGSVYLTGSSYGKNFQENCLTIKCSAEGVPLWTNQYSAANGFDGGGAIAVAGNEEVIVAGNSYSGGSSSDFVTIKYDGTSVATEGSPKSFLLKGIFGLSSNELSVSDSPNTLYLMQFATNLTSSPWIPLSTNLSRADGTCITVDAVAIGDQRYYRAVKIPEP